MLRSENAARTSKPGRPRTSPPPGRRRPGAGRGAGPQDLDALGRRASRAGSTSAGRRRPPAPPRRSCRSPPTSADASVGRSGAVRDHVRQVEDRARSDAGAGSSTASSRTPAPRRRRRRVEHGREVVGLRHGPGTEEVSAVMLSLKISFSSGWARAVGPDVHAVQRLERVLSGAHAVTEVAPRRPERRAVQGPGQRAQRAGYVGAQSLAQLGVGERCRPARSSYTPTVARARSSRCRVSSSRRAAAARSATVRGPADQQVGECRGRRRR